MNGIQHLPGRAACTAGWASLRVCIALAALLAAAAPNVAAADSDPAAHHHGTHYPAAHHHGTHAHAGHHAAAVAAVAASAKAPARTGGERWGADYFPNVPLVTHEGETVRFFDDLIKDKVVTINLVYTSCPNMCPLATAQLVRVQELLGERVGKDIFMYSITIDPENDTPEKLRAHAEKFHVGPGWLFLTGKPDDIMLLRKKLGFLADGVQVELNDHNGAILIGNQRTGQWMQRMAMNSPHVLAAQIGSWLSSWQRHEPQRLNYAHAPELEAPSMGERLFRTRCTACHTIGNVSRLVAGNRAVEAGSRLGPDLLGVTERRGRDWLVRWIKNPSRMLEDEDPVALALYAQYGEIAMPNFQLSNLEIDALLEYMREESDRVRGSARPAPVTSREPDSRPPAGRAGSDDGDTVQTRL